MTPADERRWRELAGAIRAEIRSLAEDVGAIKERIKSATGEHKKRSSEIREWLRLGVEILALAAVVAYACITRQQWKAMLQSNRISRDNVAAVQRAFITFPAEATMLYFTDPKDRGKVVYWEISFSIENSGTTPTRSMRDHVSVYVSKGACA
jgi:hypothetical protein